MNSTDRPRNVKKTSAGAPALGINAKFATPPLKHQCLSGSKDAFDLAETSEDSRVLKYALQSAARRILPRSRTAKCLRCRCQDALQVTVVHSQELKRASYAGLQTCGSVWTCPVCASKISEQRRRELNRLIQRATSEGRGVLLVTKTIRHQITDSLHDSLNGLRNADRKFKNGSAYKRIRETFGLIGTVTATEVTYGANGWHPHTHELWILEKPITPIEHSHLMAKVFPRWINSCVQAGLQPPNERGITVQDGTYACAYASKWGLSEELTKGHAKKARKDSYTPFELLNVYLSSNNKTAVQVASSLFHEYSEQFKGRAQLRFSPGLKELYDIETPTDEELSDKVDPDAEPLGHIEFEQWKIIRDSGKRAHLLNRLKDGDWKEFHKFMDELQDTRGHGCRLQTAPSPGAGNQPGILTKPNQHQPKPVKVTA